MVLSKKLWAVFSSIANFGAQLFGNGFASTDKPYVVISGKTEDSFPTNTSMRLADGVGWTNRAANFTYFHLQSRWYGKKTVLMMKLEMASKDMQFWVFDPEFYRLDGGSPISEELNCPYQTTCLVMAGWQKSAWHIERVMFAKKNNRMPLRITQLIDNITTQATSHYMFIKGPSVGKVIFNPLSLGLTGRYYNSFSFPKTCVHSKLSPLFLPSGLPDGVISFEKTSSFF
ncbi:hypothetical protein DSO57_1030376 [Entomophthora muscae]|uniref:Uncharacterized protein n=1 Tax=Entomophthora muscae TaxID=34485 RepID=A0ACC2UAD9_9FUNG|nr:hypothetical protein DSO57_1030376 [Entomophthora muscae]